MSGITYQANSGILAPINRKDVVFERGYTEDIIKVILYADDIIKSDTAQFAKHFERGNTRENLFKLWRFVRFNIKYVADPINDERVQTPAHLWKSKEGDCKSKSLFIASILQNLGIKYRYRFTAYSDHTIKGINQVYQGIDTIKVPSMKKDVTHVYVVAEVNGRDLILDAVHSKFDEEVPFEYALDFYPHSKTFTKIGNVPRLGFLDRIPSWIKIITAGVAGYFILNNCTCQQR